MKLSINTDAISQDFETAVLLGLEWGIEYFELKRIYGRRIPNVSNDEVNLIRSVLNANAAKLSSLAPGLFKIPLKEEFIKLEVGPRFDQTLELANKLENRSIVIFGFIRDDIHTESEAIDRIIDILGAVSIRAQKEGITLLLENDRGMWGDSPEAVFRIVGGINSPAFRLNWDPANLIGEYPLAPYPTGYNLLSKYIGHLHVKDAISTAQKGQFIHAIVGSGDIDWVGQFEGLLRDGYEGFCVIEPHFGSRIASSREHIFQTRKCLREAQARIWSDILVQKSE